MNILYESSTAALSHEVNGCPWNFQWESQNLSYTRYEHELEKFLVENYQLFFFASASNFELETSMINDVLRNFNEVGVFFSMLNEGMKY